MLVSDVKTRVKRQFGDESSVQVTDADILRWINDAQRVIAQNNRLLEVKGTLSTIANQQDYTLPTGILRLISIRYSTIKLQGMSLQEFDELITNGQIPGAAAATGDPNYFCVFAGSISLFPIPSTSVVNGLTIFYHRIPADRVNDADVLDLPTIYHDRVVEFCLQQAYELDENFEASKEKQQQFGDGLAQSQENESWTSQDYYPFITVSRDDM